MTDRDPSIWPDHARKFATRQERDASYDRWAAIEAARIADQRGHFEDLPGGLAKYALKKAMLKRAGDLLEMGCCGAADQLLEFVPEADAMALLDEFFPD